MNYRDKQTMLNPYQPVAIHDNPRDWLRYNPHAELEVGVDKGWLFRRFRLIGYVDTEIVWDARSANEFVKVGAQKAASKTSFLYVPKFDFELKIDDTVLPACIEVRINWLVFVTGFRLTIGEQVVYTEGTL